MKYFVLTALLLTIAAPAFACGEHVKDGDKLAQAMTHEGHNMSEMKGASPSTTAYQKSANAMHKDMSIQYSGDADVDFVQGMIPHHKGAVEMAKIELQYGKDPEIRKLAEDVVKAQEAEIKFMQEWLKKNKK